MLPFDDGLILILLLPSPQNVEVVEVQGRWRAEAPATWADALVEVATRVNAHNIMPKVTLVTLEDEEPKVSLVSSVPHFCPSGLSDAQLRAFLTQAIVYTSEFFSTLRTELPELVTWEETP